MNRIRWAGFALCAAAGGFLGVGIGEGLALFLPGAFILIAGLILLSE